MNLVGRPVLIKAGNNLNKVGIVKSREFGLYLVEIGDKTFGFEEGEIEPLFNMQEVAAVHITEVDDDGDPVNTTNLEKIMKPFGWSSEDLVGAVSDTVVDATARIKGIGHEQYAFPGYQKFEEYPLLRLFKEADDEILDGINYFVMLRVRLIRIAAALLDADVIENGDEDEDPDA